MGRGFVSAVSGHRARLPQEDTATDGESKSRVLAHKYTTPLELHTRISDVRYCNTAVNYARPTLRPSARVCMIA